VHTSEQVINSNNGMCSVVMMDKIIECLHEEGIGYPEAAQTLLG